MRSNIRKTQKRLQLRAKRSGTAVVIEWSEWPDGKGIPDPTGSFDNTDIAAVLRTVSTKAFIHTVKVSTAHRLYSEIEEGMVMLDLINSLVRITDPGSTGLLAGTVVDNVEFQTLKRDQAEAGGTQPSGTPINVSQLDKVSVVFDEERWVQQAVGDQLRRMWDAVFAGYKLSQTVLLKRSA